VLHIYYGSIYLILW